MPLGGACVAFVTIAFCAFCLPFVFPRHGPPRLDSLYLIILELLAIVFVALCAMRVVSAPRTALATVILAGSSFLALDGITIHSVKVPFAASMVDLGLLAVVVTAIWLFGVSWLFAGAIELPGWHFGVGTISGFTVVVLSALQPQSQHHAFVSLLAGILAGACAGGFLPSLRSPTFAAGQAGSLTLGFCLAVITVLGALKNTAFLILLLPLLLVGAPLIDFSFAMRRTGGEFSFTQAREPLHRALLRHGWKPVRVTILYLAIEAYLCAMAILLVLLIRVYFTVKLLVLLPFAAFGWLFFTSIVKMLAKPEREGEAPAPRDNLGSAGASPSPPTIELHDIRINVVNMAQAVAQIETFIQSRQPHMVVTSDASAIVRSQEDEQLHQIINEADLVTPDGIGVIWSARFLDLPLYERVSGVDLALALADLSAQKGYSMYLLGAAPGVVDEAAANLQGRFPGLRVAGTRHGYFRAEEEAEMVRQIREACPDILLVAFGIPKQEKWIKRYLQELQVPVCIGVGGSFDVYAGRVARAPLWMQRLGLEWLYRTARDPRRIGRALLLPRLVWLTLKRRFSKPMVNG